MTSSWLKLAEQNPRHRLPADIALEDGFNARDCGWVEQMLPFIEQFSRPGDLVLDPFCGFGTTLLAGALAGRSSVGIEMDAGRCDLSARRLESAGAEKWSVRHGDAEQKIAELSDVDLLLTNVPYFGCSFKDDEFGQLYSSESYAAYLEKMRRIFKAAKPCLKPGAHVIVMAQNLHVGDVFVPLAWDLARLLAERYRFVEDRILVYETGTTRTGAGNSDRSHEYVLIARNEARPMDLDGARRVLDEVHDVMPDLIVYGSYARYLAGDSVVPSDVDIALPFDEARILAVLESLDSAGFQILRWGKPMDSVMPLFLSERSGYLTAQRIERSGASIAFDISFSRDGETYQALSRHAVSVSGFDCCVGAVRLPD